MGVGIWPNGILCEAGDAQIVACISGAKADATLVVDERYRIFAPMVGIVAIGLSDPATVGNVIGIIPPGGFIDYTATATTLMVIIRDTLDDYGSDMDANVYLVKISDNA